MRCFHLNYVVVSMEKISLKLLISSPYASLLLEPGNYFNGVCHLISSFLLDMHCFHWSWGVVTMELNFSFPLDVHFCH